MACKPGDMWNLHPSTQQLKNAYDHLFRSGISLSKLRDATLAEKLFPNSKDGLVCGRSMAWKLFLIKLEPLETSSPPNVSLLLNSIHSSRKRYSELILEKTRAPDGSYEGGILPPSASKVPMKELAQTKNLDLNNPLSLHNENPWNEWFASLELRKTIMQDVERTFPGDPFFRVAEVQIQLTNILFLYSVINPYLAYRQGMHEILAPLYRAVYYDSIGIDNETVEEADLKDMCSSMWIAADAWTLFEALMLSMSKWYEWREPSTNTIPANTAPTSPLNHLVHFNIPEGQNGMQPYIAPIVNICRKIQSTLLKSTDPSLWKSMQTSGIEPQIYGIRWLRLLFTRELNMEDAMTLWDALFACDPSLELVQWICVAMLIRIRNDLIQADYHTKLTVLLRYTSPSKEMTESTPHHMLILLQQALALQMSPTPSTGKFVILQNSNLLNIPMNIPAPIPEHPRRGAHGRHQSASCHRISSDGGESDNNSRQSSSPIGIPEMIARGLLERGENLGINKTLMNAVSELRRNIPDLTASIIRNSHLTPNSVPLEDERHFGERPPWEPRPRFEIERDVQQIKSRDKRLAESLSWIVDILLQDESNIGDKHRLRNQKREALESLSYVRDVLMSNGMVLDDERLIGEEETRHRRQKSQSTDNPSSSPPKESILMNFPPPVPMPVNDSRIRDVKFGQIKSIPTPPSYSTSANAIRTSACRPPWIYTQSNFSTPAPNISSELPRLPPPLSRNQRGCNDAAKPGKSTGNAPDANHHYLDPLGALQ